MKYMVRLGVLSLVTVGSIALVGCGDNGRHGRTVYAPAYHDDGYYYSDGYYHDGGYYYRHRRYDYDRDRRAYRLDIRDDNRRDVYRRDVDRRDVERRDVDRGGTGRRDVSGHRGRR